MYRIKSSTSSAVFRFYPLAYLCLSHSKNAIWFKVNQEEEINFTYVVTRSREVVSKSFESSKEHKDLMFAFTMASQCFCDYRLVTWKIFLFHSFACIAYLIMSVKPYRRTMPNFILPEQTA